MPLYMFNAYGASLAWIERDRPLLRDTVAAMIEANRTMYRDPAKGIAAIVDATKKPKDAVEYAIGVLTKNCVWSVNEGLDPERTQWSIDNSVENGDIKPETEADGRAGRQHRAGARGGREGRRPRDLRKLHDLILMCRRSGAKRASSRHVPTGQSICSTRWARFRLRLHPT